MDDTIEMHGILFAVSYFTPLARIDWMCNNAMIDIIKIQELSEVKKRDNPCCGWEDWQMVTDGNKLAREFYYQMKVGFKEEQLLTSLSGALYYLYMLAGMRHIEVNFCNYGTLLLGALLMSMKIHCDRPFDNAQFMALTNLKHVARVNEIEHMFIRLCGFFGDDANFSPFYYNQYGYQVIRARFAYLFLKEIEDEEQAK